MAESTTTTSRGRRIGYGIGQFVLVGLPSLFMMLWTVDAPLIAGADAFILSFVQVLFLAIFIGYTQWRR